MGCPVYKLLIQILTRKRSHNCMIIFQLFLIILSDKFPLILLLKRLNRLSSFSIHLSMFDLSLVSLPVLLVIQSVYCNSPTVRQTANGPVEGIELNSSLGQMYYAFKGVPYAEPPITGGDPYTGENIDRRFKVCHSDPNLGFMKVFQINLTTSDYSLFLQR